MKAMKLSYKLETDKLFEKKLRRLEGITVKVWQHSGFTGAMKTFSKDVSDIDISGLSGFSIT